MTELILNSQLPEQALSLVSKFWIPRRGLGRWEALGHGAKGRVEFRLHVILSAATRRGAKSKDLLKK